MTYDPVRHVLLLFGGSDGGELGDTWVWNGTDWIKQSPALSPPARQFARLAFDTARGNAVLFGGFGGLRDTWTWDGTNWTQRHPSTIPPALDDATPFPESMAYDPIRRVTVFVTPVQHSASTAANTMDTWTWNGANWTRLAPPTSPPPRDGFGLAYDASRSLVVYASGFAFGSADPTTTWGWNGLTWSQLSGSPA